MSETQAQLPPSGRDRGTYTARQDLVWAELGPQLSGRHEWREQVCRDRHMPRVTHDASGGAEFLGREGKWRSLLGGV